MERKGDHQKLKLCYLAKIFCHETDDNHGLTINELMEKLRYYGVNVNRKTLYLDMEELRVFGMDIIAEKTGKQVRYHLGKRDFELPELKLLVDAVQSSRFITDRKSEELIHKLELLVSRYDAQQLHRQVFISGRIKSMNESIYYNVDKLHEAINQKYKIRFHYFQWNIHKEMELRKNGKWYEVSPWGLMWVEENYYLVAYDEEEDRIAHFRVDKMVDIQIQKELSAGQKQFEEFNMPLYARTQFRMHSGEMIMVTMQCKNNLVGVFLDRFGMEIPIIPVDEEHFQTQIPVLLSQQFLSWVFGMGDDAKIMGPANVVEMMKDALVDCMKLYEQELK